MNWYGASGREIAQWWQTEMGGRTLVHIDGRLIDEYINDGVEPIVWFAYLLRCDPTLRTLRAHIGDSVLDVDALQGCAEVAVYATGRALPPSYWDYVDLRDIEDAPGTEERFQRAAGQLRSWIDETMGAIGANIGTRAVKRSSVRSKQTRAATITRLDR